LRESSSFRKRVAQRELLLGSLIATACPQHVEILGRLGYDFVFIDLEHGDFFLSDLRGLIIAADAQGITPLVRVSWNRPEYILKALDLGAKGVILPHVGSKDELVKAVESALYPPKGSRGAAPCIRSAGYFETNWEQFQDKSNEEVLVIPCIEDKKGMENLSSMLDIDGVDIFCLGPFDYSVDIGLPGKRTDPKVVNQMRRAAEEIISSGKHVMYPVLDFNEMEEWVKVGVRIFVYGIDTVIYAMALRNFLEKAEEIKRRLSSQ
jgi:2-keto-3-deoxy-L-rhamnonate aldolase RhmA